jgi:hypothetical protein
MGPEMERSAVEIHDDSTWDGVPGPSCKAYFCPWVQKGAKLVIVRFVVGLADLRWGGG